MAIKETEWMCSVADELRSPLRDRLGPEANIDCVPQHRLAYAHEINEYKVNVPSGIRSSEYATDLLIVDRNPNETWIPRVIIEGKLGKVTTHDALTYSAKAATHKSVHPYLRYGILIGDWADYSLPARLFRHGAHFDFMMTWRELMANKKELSTFLDVLASEIVASRSIQRLLLENRSRDKKVYRLIHKPLQLFEP